MGLSAIADSAAQSSWSVLRPFPICLSASYRIKPQCFSIVHSIPHTYSSTTHSSSIVFYSSLPFQAPFPFFTFAPAIIGRDKSLTKVLDSRLQASLVQTLQHRAFSIVGPSAWNSLPSEIRSLPRDLSSSFYKLLKTFIFARAWAASASE